METSNAKPLAAMTVEVAHQFRELLTIVLGSLEQLERQTLDDCGRQQLKRAESAARHIGEMINGEHAAPHR